MSRPQDATVSRRWFLDRMAWVTSAAALGGAVVPTHLAGRETTRAYLRTIPDPRPLQEVVDLTELTLAETVAFTRRGLLAPEDLVRPIDDPRRHESVPAGFSDRVKKRLRDEGVEVV